ncbi:hypothetical protein NA57DRAFT_57541 [Rhizodiscina lignyota]|uniref:Uncharacterized protein n=1 Tax=Rhizodiscina lignyota TaxID=1504668 RepID=A0A9P4IHM9_9PEZI|nr:hypothetical protein NA57DRAFT_57541 [Rhizodiscina lignyota]
MPTRSDIEAYIGGAKRHSETPTSAGKKRDNDEDRELSPEKKITKKLRPGGLPSRTRAHATNNQRMERMSHIHISEESEDDSLFVPEYRSGLKERIEQAKERMEEAKLRKSQSATPTTAYGRAHFETPAEDSPLASVEEAGEMEEEVNTYDEQAKRNAPTAAMLPPARSAATSMHSTPASAVAAAAAKARSGTSTGASPSLSALRGRERQLAELEAMRQKVQKAKEKRAAKQRENEEESQVIEDATLELNASHRAEMEELQKQLEEENEAFDAAEEESARLRAERERVKDELARKRGESRVKTEPVE